MTPLANEGILLLLNNEVTSLSEVIAPKTNLHQSWSISILNNGMVTTLFQKKGKAIIDTEIAGFNK